MQSTSGRRYRATLRRTARPSSFRGARRTRSLAHRSLSSGQAIDQLRAQPRAFDVVLMDVQMPVMDGLTATRLIRADPALAALPVIALTAGVLAEERQAALDAGVTDFLPKPLDLQVMRQVLSRHTGKTPVLLALDGEGRAE